MVAHLNKNYAPPQGGPLRKEVHMGLNLRGGNKELKKVARCLQVKMSPFGRLTRIFMETYVGA